MTEQDVLDVAMARYYFKQRHKVEIVLKAEHQLFVAIILQAIDDLFSKPLPNAKHDIRMQREKDIESAYNFFFKKDPFWAKHREMVFFYAGLEPDLNLEPLRRRYLEMSEMR